jgi:small-conductance mechanosensitive channel
MMLADIRVAYLQIIGAISLLPNWIVSLASAAAAILAALLAYALIVRIVRRTLGARHPYLRSLLARTKGTFLIALMMAALAIVLPMAPIDPVAASRVSGLLHVAFVALTGWMAITAVDIGARLYLQRFQLDIENNLLARKHVTQVGILTRLADILIVMITLATALMSFESVRQIGVSLFASAGVAGLAVGLAARPLVSNFIAGVQIAITQPIRLHDGVFLEGEYGVVEEITTTYVIVKLWDWRRIVLPLSYFIEKPFQNWTRETSALIGAVFLYLDYTAPVEKLRAKLMEIAHASPLWDGGVVVLQVSDAKERTLELRALISARSVMAAWDLRCEVRERLIAYLQAEYPEALPRTRAEVVDGSMARRAKSPAHAFVPES